RIGADFSGLDWTLSYEDAEGDNADEIVAALSDVPFERLDPLEQFLRLCENPNPWQTGRAFRSQQLIRLDFTGRAITYLEGGEGNGLPTAWYGISPDRMWPARAKTGELIGWVMDKDRPGGGVPFGREEIAVTEYPGPYEDPVGVVEAVYAHISLTRALPQHTSDMLATGGRLAGMAWPKERSLSEDEFADAQRAWRNVTSDPNAARRLLLFPEPMEYQAGAATPQEIGIPELATLNRDEILTAFPIAPEMLMVPMATGLNSGQTQQTVDERYWSGTMHPRVEAWEDAFQQQVIPRYEKAVGRALDFDIEEPNLDNAETLTTKADAYKSLVAIGFDPKEAVAAVGLDHIKWNGLPDLMDPAKQAQAAQAATEALANRPTDQQQPMANMPMDKPPQKAVKARRERVVGETLPGFKATMSRFLRDQRVRVAADVERVIGPLTKAQRKALPDDWWNPTREDGLLRDALRGLYVRLATSALQVVADDRDRVVTRDRINRVTEQMLEKAGERITGINETTRAAVADQIAEGVRRGYSIGQIVNGVADEAYRGIEQAAVFDEVRSELVARTETMLAYNESALRGYSEFGVSEVEAIDGDDDEACAERNGQVFSIEDALAVDEHPNGTLDWAPISN
ncbi:MAG TPA: phage portal protein, partial [Candidatus Limnocylindrales bacterium]